GGGWERRKGRKEKEERGKGERGRRKRERGKRGRGKGERVKGKGLVFSLSPIKMYPFDHKSAKSTLVQEV
ncbi:hypothetical protein, partial [Nostoc linckia]|uniref:hypothetical protein n=1 Tax=Nostoc linckia TaxID=92942 RepID=UPI0015D5039A